MGSFGVGVRVLNLIGLGGGGKSSSDRSAQNFGTYFALSLPLPLFETCGTEVTLADLFVARGASAL